jgi:hypothetical protein
MAGFKNSTRTISGHHNWDGKTVGGVENFHSNMQGSALVRRQTPTTQLDRDAGNTSSLEPGFAKGGKAEKHFHVHHHYHGGKVTRSKAARMEMQGETESPASESKPFAKGGKMHLNPKHKGKFTQKMTGSKKGHLTGKDVSKGLHSKSPETRQEANFARMARRDFKPLAEGGHVHDDTSPVAPDYARGGVIGKSAGGALYAAGGKVSRENTDAKADAVQARRIAKQVVHEHVGYPAPKGHKGLGKMLKR